jgi:hypothetical protein
MKLLLRYINWFRSTVLLDHCDVEPRHVTPSTTLDPGRMETEIAKKSYNKI